MHSIGSRLYIGLIFNKSLSFIRSRLLSVNISSWYTRKKLCPGNNMFYTGLFQGVSFAGGVFLYLRPVQNKFHFFPLS